MDPTLISVDANDRPSGGGEFRAREMRRILALAWPYRGTLLAGLISTIVFASLHTISIGGAFPVFKILLEEEGLRGWVDRTVAGQRLGIEFAPVTNRQTTSLKIVKANAPGSLCPNKECLFETLSDKDGRAALEFLHELAYEEPTDSYPVNASPRLNNPSGAEETVLIDLSELDFNMRLLRWAGSLMPADADQEKLRTLGWILAGLIVIVLFANVFRYLGEVLISKAILRAMMSLRARLYERTLHLPMSFFAGQPTADVVTRFVQDVQEIQRGMLTLFGKFIREPLRAAFILVLAFTLDWRITLTLLVVAPLAVLIFLAVGRSVKNANRKLLQAYGMMIDALTTSLQNLRVVKAYTAEDYERERLWQVDLRMFAQQLKLAKLRAFVTPMMEVIAIVAGSCVTVWLAGRVLNHDLSVSKFAALGVTVSMLFDPLRKLSDVYVRVQRSTAGAERIFQVIDQPVEKDYTKSPIEVEPLRESIEYVNVSFTYPGAAQPAIQNVSLSIRQGETIALVGPNGCGKTTLTSMLPRLFTPDAGEILYDGLDVRRVDLKNLRTQIGLVSQEAVVFAGTPVENIAYGVPSTDESAVVDAARRASADEFIRSISGGYAGSLGERGTTLSGGQRQRLAIARAIFRDAPILIFDEATSQIDTESEQKIQNALKEFSKGRTTLIIAHRLSTIQFANRIVVMDAGRIIDTGTHEELFNRCTLYRNLCETQFVTG
ncbi:MAG: ABC transporter ATP-binding protein [Phycisphaerales bacterium]|nr:MAG: ABC transporter ATP-binding protein [Phycisphaerales bacterium]